MSLVPVLSAFQQTGRGTSPRSSVGNSEDLVPLIFSFLSPSSYVACSLVCSLWEIISRRHIYEHITALRGLTFSQCIALFTGDRNLAQHIRSCCFHYSIPASRYIDDNISTFVQYIISTCTNLVALTFWDVPLHGDAFDLLPKTCVLRVLTFQNSTWDYTVLQNLLDCCTNTQLLQFSTSPLFSDDRAYHRLNVPQWWSQWRHKDRSSSKPSPTSILINSTQRPLYNSFWKILDERIDFSHLKNLKLLAHKDDASAASMFISSSLHTIRHLETSILCKLYTTSLASEHSTGPLDLTTGANLTHIRLNTFWGTRNVSQPTLKSLPQTDSLIDLVIVFHVGAVNDEIMRSVVAALEDLKDSRIPTVTFAFRRLGQAAVPKHALSIVPVVISKMREFMGSEVVIRAKWLGVK